MDITYFDRKTETARRKDLARHQTARMQGVLREVLETNPFYGKKLREAGLTNARDFTSLTEVTWLPFTRKQELVEDHIAHPPFGSNLTYPLEKYIRTPDIGHDGPANALA